MNVLRGVTCWLALFGFVALATALPGCDDNTDKTNRKSSGQKTKTDQESGSAAKSKLRSPKLGSDK